MLIIRQCSDWFCTLWMQQHMHHWLWVATYVAVQVLGRRAGYNSGWTLYLFFACLSFFFCACMPMQESHVRHCLSVAASQWFGYLGDLHMMVSLSTLQLQQGLLYWFWDCSAVVQQLGSGTQHRVDQPSGYNQPWAGQQWMMHWL